MILSNVFSNKLISHNQGRLIALSWQSWLAGTWFMVVRAWTLPARHA